MEVIYYPPDINCYVRGDIKAWALNNGLDYICEIHRNAGGGQGYETLVKGGYDSVDLLIHNAMVGLGFRDRGIKLRSDLANMNRISGICSYSLIEVGFIDSPADNTIFDYSDIGKTLYNACQSAGVQRLGIIYGHGQGDPGAIAYGRQEADDVRIIKVVGGPAVKPMVFDKQDIYIQVHIQDTGWQDWKNGNDLVGTTGEGKRVEAIRMKLGSPFKASGIKYRMHIQNEGWHNWNGDGDMNGTEGKSLRAEAIQIELTGNIALDYDVIYRVHCQDIGWLEWVKNGEVAGTTGKGLRMEALQVILVKK